MERLKEAYRARSTFLILGLKANERGANCISGDNFTIFHIRSIIAHITSLILSLSPSLFLYEEMLKKQNNPKFDGYIMKVDVEHFGCFNLLQEL